MEHRKGWRRRVEIEEGATFEDAELVDLSMTGAGIIAPFDPTLVEGSSVRVEWGGSRAVVEIRQIGAGPSTGASHYGVVFLDMDHDFERQVADYIGAHRPISVEALRPEWD